MKKTGDTIKNVISYLPYIWSSFRYFWTNLDLISSFQHLPKIPTNWKDETQVKPFIKDIVNSETVIILVTKTDTQLDDKARLLLAQAISIDIIWNMAWQVYIGDIKDSTPDHKNLRQRIRSRISDIRKQLFSTELSDQIVEDSSDSIIYKTADLIDGFSKIYNCLR